MARKKSMKDSPSQQVKTELTTDVSDAERQLTDRIARGRELISPPPDSSAALELTRKRYYTWDEYNTTLLGRLFSTDELSREYSYWGITVVGGPKSLAEEIADFVSEINDKIRRLESIIERLPLYAPAGARSSLPSPPPVDSATT